MSTQEAPERVTVQASTLELLDTHRSDDGGRESYDEVIRKLARGDIAICDRIGCPNQGYAYDRWNDLHHGPESVPDFLCRDHLPPDYDC